MHGWYGACGKRRMQIPSISLVTCSYQQAPYLEQAMRSVLEQDYPALEYVVIDGGSTDGSVPIIRKYERALTHWESGPDGGQTHALIRGFEHCSGDIMGWLCSDDLLLAGALNTVGEFFARNPEVNALYGDALWIDARGRLVRPKREMRFSRFVLLHDHNYIPQPSMFWRRSLYEQVGGLDARFDLAMDADLWERFSAIGPIEHIPAYLSCMRWYPSQKTRARRSEALREEEIIRARDVERSLRPAHVRARRLAARGLRIATKLLDGGYGARVPVQQLDWLGRMAALGAAH
jgi:glycosyltransferase involved in cell wall biosynthesis